MERTVCGIDPGLATTGYAILHISGGRSSVVDAGVCRFDPKLPLAERLTHIDRDISSILTEHRPEVVAVEDLYAHYKHPRTAILMGHARGVILCAAARSGMEVLSFAATRIKRYLTGNGHANKGQMQRAVQTALCLPALPEPSDVADALAIAMCCADEIGQANPVEVSA